MADSLADLIARRAGAAPDGVYLLNATGDRIVTWSELHRAVAQRIRRTDRRQEIVPIHEPLAGAVELIAGLAAGHQVAPVDGQAAGPVLEELVTRIGSVPEAPGWAGSLLLFSSGSTGPRKPVRLSEATLLAAAENVVAAHRLTPDDRGLCPLPLHHINAEVVGLLSTVVCGGSLVLPGRFSRRDFWRCAVERRVTWLNLVPAVVSILAAAPVPACERMKDIRFARSASAPLPSAVLDRFERATGLPVIETYGMTEAASQITANALDGRRAGSVGRPVGVELQVRRDGGAPCDPHETGRVHIRGRSVITAYADGSGPHTFDPSGWLDTGDLGYYDRDGFLYLVGRATEVINNAGEKVFPREVEDVLFADPAVAEAAVIGRVDHVRTNVPVAYVTLVDGVAGDDAVLEALQARCSDRLPRPAQPVEIRVVDALPRGATGKLSRSDLVRLDAAATRERWQPAA